MTGMLNTSVFCLVNGTQNETGTLTAASCPETEIENDAAPCFVTSSALVGCYRYANHDLHDLATHGATNWLTYYDYKCHFIQL